MPAEIALCAIARNEAQNLPRLLDSVRDVVGEIVLVDTGSTDATAAIARQRGARVVTEPWQDSFARARNAGLEAVQAPWVLVLDADEALHPDDRTALRALPDQLTEAEGCFLPVISFLGVQPGHDQLHDARLALFRNRPEHRFSGVIHEQILPAIRAARPHSQVITAPVRILHYGYLSAGGDAPKRERNLRILAAAQQQEPHEPFWLYALANESIGAGDYAQALTQLDAAERAWTPAHPHYSDVLRKQVICLTELGRPAQALAIARAGLELYPAYTDLAFLAGLAQVRAGNRRAARAWFSRCLLLGAAPVQFQSWSGVGGFRTRAALGALTGQPEEAAAHFLAALQEAPDWASARAGLAGALARMAPEAALAWLGAHLDLDDGATVLALGKALLAAGAVGHAALLAQPRAGPAHYLLAAMLWHRRALALGASATEDAQEKPASSE